VYRQGMPVVHVQVSRLTDSCLSGVDRVVNLGSRNFFRAIRGGFSVNAGKVCCPGTSEQPTGNRLRPLARGSLSISRRCGDTPTYRRRRALEPNRAAPSSGHRHARPRTALGWCPGDRA
jgi:hypothetical protein